jgi:hypothetical protein
MVATITASIIAAIIVAIQSITIMQSTITMSDITTKRSIITTADFRPEIEGGSFPPFFIFLPIFIP